MKRSLLSLSLVIYLTSTSSFGTDLQTTSYHAPPAFLAEWEKATESTQKTRSIHVLEKAGVAFGDGTSAIFDPGTSQLFVRNRVDQLELVKAFLASIHKGARQFYISVREVSFVDESFPDGWDGEFQMGQESIKLSDLEMFPKSPGKTIISLPPLPEASRGERSVVFDSEEEIHAELSRPPVNFETRDDLTGRVGKRINGILTDPQFQVLIRALSQKPDVDLVSMPSTLVKAGQFGFLQTGNKRYAVEVLPTSDKKFARVRIFLPQHGEALIAKSEPLTTPYEVTIPDRKTVVIAERREEGGCRIVFVKVDTVDVD